MIETWGSVRSLCRALVVAGTALLLAAQIPARAADEIAAKAFLQAIYQQYLGNAGQSGHEVAIDTPAKMRRYFTPDVIRLMTEDAANAKNHRDVPALDGDPFVDAQDWEIAHVVVEVNQTAPTKATGTVTFTNSDKPQKVVLHLADAGRGWRVDDIQWSDGSLRGLYRKK